MKSENIGNKIDTCPVCEGTQIEQEGRFERVWSDEAQVVMRCCDCDYKFFEVWKLAYNLDYKEE